MRQTCDPAHTPPARHPACYPEALRTPQEARWVGTGGTGASVRGILPERISALPMNNWRDEPARVANASPLPIFDPSQAGRPPSPIPPVRLAKRKLRSPRSLRRVRGLFLLSRASVSKMNMKRNGLGPGPLGTQSRGRPILPLCNLTLRLSEENAWSLVPVICAYKTIEGSGEETMQRTRRTCPNRHRTA
jgi:hypothetical protein